jgi:hypothetical protein
MNRRTIGVCIVLFALPAMLLAQGTSPLKVTRITISPASVAAGARVAISVSIQNTSTATYGCSGPNSGVTVYVFKAEPYSTANKVWETTQPVAPFAAGETRAVPISTQWVVPAGDVESYHIVAWSGVCGSDEFGQQAALKLRKACTYSALPTLLLPNIKVPLKIRP